MKLIAAHSDVRMNNCRSHFNCPSTFIANIAPTVGGTVSISLSGIDFWVGRVGSVISMIFAWHVHIVWKTSRVRLDVDKQCHRGLLIIGNPPTIRTAWVLNPTTPDALAETDKHSEICWSPFGASNTKFPSEKATRHFLPALFASHSTGWRT